MSQHQSQFSNHPPTKPPQQSQPSPKKPPIRLRLRLKKSSPQILQNPQSGPISSILHEQNNKLARSVNKLADIDFEGIGGDEGVGRDGDGLREFVENVFGRYGEKMDLRRELFRMVLRGVRKELRGLAGEVQGVLTREPELGVKSIINPSQPTNIQSTNNLSESQPTNPTKSPPLSPPLSPQSPLPTNPSHSSHPSHVPQESDQSTKDLHLQITQMQHYILQMKQLLNQKDTHIAELNNKISVIGEELRKIKDELGERNRVCRILQEEVLGYQGKVQLLEGKILGESKDGLGASGRMKGSKESYGKNHVNNNKVHETQSIYSDVQEYQHKGQKSQNKASHQKEKDKKNSEQLSNGVLDQNNQHDPDQEQAENDDQSYEHNEVDIDDRQSRQLKLQQIYAKTEQALKKYKSMSEEVNNKQIQCSMLANKISIILSVLGIQQISQVYSMQQGDLMLMINNHIQKTHQKLNEQYNDRQSKFESMISTQLDQVLTSIQQQLPPQHQIQLKPYYTIFDKIQSVNELVHVIIGSRSVGDRVEMLMVFYRRLEEIMRKSEEFKVEFTENNRVLLKLCEEVDRGWGDGAEGGMGTGEEDRNGNGNQVGEMLKEKLEAIQNLLKENQKQLGMSQQQVQSNPSSKLTGMNTTQIESYLQQLQTLIKNLQRTHKKTHQTCKKQQQNLQQQLKQQLSFNTTLLTKIQQITAYISHIKANQEVSQVGKLLGVVVERIQGRIGKDEGLGDKEDKDERSGDGEGEEESGEGQAKLGDIGVMKKKYFHDSPQFVDDIMTKLMKIRNTETEQAVLQIADSILNLIQMRDTRIKSQIGRRRQLIKQRTAAIAQICKQGMRDSSFQSSIKKQ